MEQRDLSAPSAAAGLPDASRRLAGVLLICYPTVIYGGVTLLRLLLGDTGFADEGLRRDLWRAGHAHAGVLLLLSLVVLRYVDEARLSARVRAFVRHSVPAAALLLPAAFFGSVLRPGTAEPGALVWLAIPGALALAAGLLTLGVGLLRRPAPLEPLADARYGAPAGDGRAPR